MPDSSIPPARVHLGDAVVLKATAYDQDGEPIDVSTATTLQLRAVKPGATTLTAWDAEVTTDGTDGVFQYETTPGTDLSLVGTYLIEGYFVFPGGKPTTTDPYKLKVHPTLAQRLA